MSISQNFVNLRPSLLLDFSNTEALDPRVSFSRPTTATYYDDNTSVVAEQNLIAYSQTFSSWGIAGATVTANSTTAPDGTTTASTLTGTSGGYTQYIQIASTGSTGATVSTFSCYLKAGTISSVRLYVYNAGGGANYYCTYNLSTVTAVPIGGGTTATITSVGSGWYYCTVTGTSATGSSYLIPVIYADNGNFYIWGSQLEQRGSATAYTPTTGTAITNYIPVLLTQQSNEARFDHNPTTRESLGLLIEEQRTNLLTYSSDFSNAVWTKSGATITADTIIAPDGTLTGDKLTETTASSTPQTYQAVSVTAGSYTYSVYAKQVSSSRYLAVYPQASTVGWAIFNLSTGAITATGGGGYLSSSITSVGNGWYRCSVTWTAATTTAYGVCYITNSTTNPTTTYTGDGFSGLYLWGAQLEAGAFATSYIPTVASQVTRSADSASMTGTNFSSWYNNAEGTIYIDSIVNTGIAGAYPLYINDTTGNNYIRLTAATTTLSYQVGAFGTNNVNITNSGLTNNAPYKCAFVYKTNDCAVSFNGGTVTTDTANTIPVVNTLNIGTFSGVTATTTIKKIAYYPIRVTNAQLQGLTG